MQKVVIFLIASISIFQVSTGQNIPSPSEFLGYDIGTQFSRHHQVVDYFKTIAKQRPNEVKLRTIWCYQRAETLIPYVHF